MSRFTSSPFHRPPPFVQGLHPPSPPDTYSDPSATHHPIPHSSGLGMQDYVPSDEPTISPEIGTPRSKKSSLPYHLSGFREKERSSTPRNSKCLVIVMPPPTLFKDQEHVLAGTVHHRLLQGVVLPLFPSMYAQVTAIAREFNFPSTSGLSLYFHHLEGGIAFAPRVSEEAWPIIWSHISDPTVANERRSLFSGRLEFDIDLRLARWYSAWLASLLRDTTESIYVHPSTAPSFHQRQESRSTILDSKFDDSVIQEPVVIVQRSAPVNGRHIPRKLSLVERYDVVSNRSEARGPSKHVQESLAVSHALSTIKQEDEPPRAAREVINDRVESWRESAIPARSPLTSKGQVSLDPSNLPNNLELDLIVKSTETEDEDEEIRLEDFQWDASSAGPLSPLESLLSWGRVPSVHLAGRLEGSVCSTPSVCTSFGPMDYDPLSPVLSLYRLPSPDLAHRMFESAPPTPLTATSWGAPSWPASPLYVSRPPSPDLAHRMIESTPPTPLTATSWGAPSWPPSPRCVSPTPSLDLGERSMFPELAHLRPDIRGASSSTQEIHSTVYPVTQIYPEVSRPWQMVWPYTNDFIREHQGTAWPLVWPYTEEFVQENRDAAWPMVWPYTEEFISEHKGKPWELVWPFVEDLIKGYQDNGWHFVWPYTEEFIQTVQEDQTWQFVWPYTSSFVDDGASKENPWQFVWPYTNRFITASASENAVSVESPPLTGTVCPSVELESIYPDLVIYPAVYPHNLVSIYPPTTLSTERPVSRGGPVSMEACSYPVFDIYPAVYPNFELYPEVVRPDKAPRIRPMAQSAPVTLETRYPYFNIYPPVYPNLEVYPPRHGEETVAKQRSVKPITVTLEAGYPSFNLYPPVYPYFDLYPSTEVQPQSTPHVRKAIQTTLEARYPSFNLYPPVYPHFDIYPSVTQVPVKLVTKSSKQPIETALEPCYPSFNIYPAGYPHFDIYPSTKVEELGHPSRAISVTLTPAYPFIELYPPVYPHLEIYPAVAKSESNGLPNRLRLPPVSVVTETRYPYFNIYPAVYPHIDVYPELGPTVVQRKRCAYKPSRLTHSELHAMVMMERMGSQLSSFEPREWTRDSRDFGTSPKPAPSVPLPPIPLSASPSMRSSRGRSGSIARPTSSLPLNPRPQSSLLSSAKVSPESSPSRLSGLPPVSSRLSSRLPRLGSVDEWPIPPPLPQSLLSGGRSSPPQPRKIPSFAREVPGQHRSMGSSSSTSSTGMGRRDSLVMQLAKSYEASVNMATSS